MHRSPSGRCSGSSKAPGGSVLTSWLSRASEVSVAAPARRLRAAALYGGTWPSGGSTTRDVRICPSTRCISSVGPTIRGYSPRQDRRRETLKFQRKIWVLWFRRLPAAGGDPPLASYLWLAARLRLFATCRPALL